jgi:hypothetical protein
LRNSTSGNLVPLLLEGLAQLDLLGLDALEIGDHVLGVEVVAGAT